MVDFTFSVIDRLKGISCVCTATIGVTPLAAWRQLGNIWWQKAIAKYTMVMVTMMRKQSWKNFMIIAAGFSPSYGFSYTNFFVFLVLKLQFVTTCMLVYLS